MSLSLVNEKELSVPQNYQHLDILYDDAFIIFIFIPETEIVDWMLKQEVVVKQYLYFFFGYTLCNIFSPPYLTPVFVG